MLLVRFVFLRWESGVGRQSTFDAFPHLPRAKVGGLENRARTGEKELVPCSPVHAGVK